MELSGYLIYSYEGRLKGIESDVMKSMNQWTRDEDLIHPSIHLKYILMAWTADVIEVLSRTGPSAK